MTEFRVDGWAIGTAKDLGKRSDQYILCKVIEVASNGAIVSNISGQLIDTANSPRSWFAPKDRDDGCARVWSRGKTQWRSYRNMLGVLAQAQTRATQDPNKVWEPLDERFLLSPASAKPVSAPTPPPEALKPPQPQPNELDPDIENTPRMVRVKKHKSAIMKDANMTESDWLAYLEQVRCEILCGKDQ